MSAIEVTSAAMKLLKMHSAGKLDGFGPPGMLLGEFLGEYRRNKIDTPAELVRFMVATETIRENLFTLIEELEELPVWPVEIRDLIAAIKEGLERWILDVRGLSKLSPIYRADMEEAVTPLLPPRTDAPSSSTSNEPDEGPGDETVSGVCGVCNTEQDGCVVIMGFTVCPDCLEKLEETALEVMDAHEEPEA